MSNTDHKSHSISINYTDKYFQDQKIANMNDNRHQIQLKHEMQVNQNRKHTTKRTLSNGVINQNGGQVHPTFNTRVHNLNYDRTATKTKPEAPTWHVAVNGGTNEQNLVNGNGITNLQSDMKHAVRKSNKESFNTNENMASNKQHLTNNELLFRRIINMFNKSYIWTTLKYGRSGNGRKRGRLFRKKYKNGYSENLLNAGDVNEVYRSDSFKFERFPKGQREVVRTIPDSDVDTQCAVSGVNGISSALFKVI